MADVHVNQPCELCSLGTVCWVSRVTLCGCTLGSGVMQIVGTVMVEGSQFVTVRSSWVLALKDGKNEVKKRQGWMPLLSPHVAGTNEHKEDRKQWEVGKA